MSEPPESNFIKEMGDALKEQLVEDEKAKSIAKIMADEGAKKWLELRSWISTSIEAINDELPEFILSYDDSGGGGLVIVIDHELNDRNVKITFNFSSAEISYQGTNCEGVFRPRVNGSTLDYQLQQTKPIPPDRQDQSGLRVLSRLFLLFP
jgi:hypothetical protein